MKRVSAIGLILILFTLTSHAQKPYSTEKLAQTSQEDLNVLLEKAKKNKTTGMIFTIVGPVAVASMFILNEATGGIDLDTAGILFFGGSVATLIGLPVLIVNSSRVNKINNVLSDRVFIEIAPCRFHNYMAQNHQNGVIFRIRF